MLERACNCPCGFRVAGGTLCVLYPRVPDFVRASSIRFGGRSVGSRYKPLNAVRTLADTPFLEKW